MNLVAIASFLDPMRAQIAKGLLEQNGMFATVFDDASASQMWGNIPALGGVRLCVLEDDAEQARACLATLSEIEDEPGERCPKCGSGRILRPRNLLSLLGTWMIGVPMPLDLGRRMCAACKTSWSEADAGSRSE